MRSGLKVHNQVQLKFSFQGDLVLHVASFNLCGSSY